MLIVVIQNASFRIPNLTLTTNEEGQVEIELSDDPYDCTDINVEKCPVIITCNKVCYIRGQHSRPDLCTGV